MAKLYYTSILSKFRFSFKLYVKYSLNMIQKTILKSSFSLNAFNWKGRTKCQVFHFLPLLVCLAFLVHLHRLIRRCFSLLRPNFQLRQESHWKRFREMSDDSSDESSCSKLVEKWFPSDLSVTNVFSQFVHLECDWIPSKKKQKIMYHYFPEQGFSTFGLYTKVKKLYYRIVKEKGLKSQL